MNYYKEIINNYKEIKNTLQKTKIQLIIKLINNMEIVDGTNTKNLIKRNLQILFSNVLAKKCYWSGSGR